jgi:hypothetical protein
MICSFLHEEIVIIAVDAITKSKTDPDFFIRNYFLISMVTCKPDVVKFLISLYMIDKHANVILFRTALTEA